MLNLRPYQREGVESIHAAFMRGMRQVLYVLPTGGGKTFLFAWMAAQARDHGTPTLILVHRRELLKQASDTLTSLNVPHGLIAPNHPRTQHCIQIASVQTLARREMPPCQFLIIDEAHHTPAGSWKRILNLLDKNTFVLGVTATPCRLSGRGLAKFFQVMIQGPNYSELIEGGFLAPCNTWSPSRFEMHGLRKRGGDWDRGELAELMENAKAVTGDAVEHYTRLCPGVPAVVFCVSVVHAELVAHAFREAGYRASAVSGKTPDKDRDRAIQGLALGETQLLVACDLVSEGLDVPAATCAIGLRPTDSLSLYIQQVGRILRPATGKTAISLDHVGNAIRHGLPTRDRIWSLEKGINKQEANPEPARQCPECYFVHDLEPYCPACGYEYPKPERAESPSNVDGTLELLTEDEMDQLLEGASTLKQYQALARRMPGDKTPKQRSNWAYGAWKWGAKPPWAKGVTA